MNLNLLTGLLKKVGIRLAADRDPLTAIPSQRGPLLLSPLSNRPPIPSLQLKNR